MKNLQINCRVDQITYSVLKELNKKLHGSEKSKQSQTLRKAIFELGERELGKERLTEIVYLTYKE